MWLFTVASLITSRPAISALLSPSATPLLHLGRLHPQPEPAVHGSGFVWSDLAVLVAWAAIGLAIALRRFAWSPAAATG
ncbi:MAG TPA: hypothetical protein VGL44_15135 [Gaiellales bacterium]